MTTKIKRYRTFLEDLQVSPNDSPVARMAKQAINSDSDYLKDYNAKKQKITDLFTAVGPDGKFKFDDETLKIELEKELGKEVDKDGEDRNPLIQELTVVLDLQRQLTKLDRQNTEDKTRMDEAGDEKALEEGPRKDELSKRFDKLKAKVGENVARMSEMSRKISDAKKSFDKKMADFLKNVQESTEEIKKATPK